MAREKFSIATFNVKNLVNSETNYYQKRDGSWNRYSKSAFERKVNWIAIQLAKMDADHVCLQEVFHVEALRAVAARYAEIIERDGLNQDRYAEIIHVPNVRSKKEDPKPGLGYLGRKKLVSHEEVQDICDRPIEFDDEFGLSYTLTSLSRPVSVLEIDIGNERTGVLINAHLKSKRPILARNSEADDPGKFLFLDRAKGSIGSLVLRAGEALALRRELIDIMGGTSTPVFVVGDLNDEAGAVTSEVVRGEAPWRHQDVSVKRGFWDVELYSAARTHLRRSERSDFTTYIYNGHHCTIDHIFFSQEFYYRKPDRLGDLDYLRAFNDHLIDNSVHGAPYVPDVSDHGQLVAHFSYKKKKKSE